MDKGNYTYQGSKKPEKLFGSYRELLSRFQAIACQDYAFANDCVRFLPFSFLLPASFGTDFLLVFPEGFGNITKIQINIVALTRTTVKLTSPVPGVNNTVAVDPSMGAAVNLQNTLVQTSLMKEHKYVHVESDHDISVAVVEYIPGHSSDGYLAIPTNKLGSRYFFTNTNNGRISILALNDNTYVNVTQPYGYKFISDRGNVSSLSLLLSKLESYQVKCRVPCTGYLHASSAVSLWYGSCRDGYNNFYYTTSSVEEGTLAYQGPSMYIVQVLYISRYATNIVECLSDRYMQIKTSHNTSALYGPSTYISAFKSAQYITTNQSATCTYSGHGFSVSIPPVKAYTNYYRFLTPSVMNFTHRAAIMIRSHDKDGVRLDNSHPNFLRQETVKVESMSYTVMYLNVTSGQHDITHITPSVDFGVILYGFGVSGTGSYAYPGGFK